MINLLNAVSSTIIGIISIIFILAILFITIIANLKMKKYSIVTNFISFTVALLLAIFLAKPMLSMFDKMFSFSMVFFNIFMFKFGQIDIMNKQVTLDNYSLVVTEFKNASLGMSDSLKEFLNKIFDNSSVSATNPTTLGAIASTSISYMFAIFIVALILFIVSFVLLKLLFAFLNKKIEWKMTKINQKLIGGIFGGLKAITIVLIFLITISTLPIFGISVDYFGTGFESTVVFNPVYTFVVNTEQNVYINSIDFNEVNKKSFADKSNLEFGSYQNNLEGADYRINVQIGNESIICVINNLITAESQTDAYQYIYTNNTLYLYKNNKINFSLKYNEKNKVLTYQNVIGETSVKYYLNLIS